MRCDWRRWVALLLMISMGCLAAPGAAPAAQQTLYVQPASANLRESPAIEPGNRLDSLPGGTPLNAFEREGDWYPVQLNDGRTGWMHRSVLGPAPPAMPAPEARLPRVRIGIVQDGEGLETAFLPIFQREIRDLLRQEHDIRFPDAMRLQGDWTAPGRAGGAGSLAGRCPRRHDPDARPPGLASRRAPPRSGQAGVCAVHY